MIYSPFFRSGEKCRLALFHTKKCLLVDFDPQANLTSSLGFSTDNLDTMVPVLQDEKSVRDVTKRSRIENLDLICAPKTPT